MAHYAFLNEGNEVTEVIVGVEDFNDDWELKYAEIRGQTCKKTSYNTSAGVHASGGIPFRKNFAGIGFTYDPVRDAFIPPCPGEGYTLDDETCQWIETV